MLASLFGCCQLQSRYYGSADDKLEVIAIVGFQDVPKCVIPGKQLPIEVDLNSEFSAWVKLVFYDNILTPAEEGRKLNISAIDSFGSETLDLNIEPQVLTINGEGFSSNRIVIKVNKIGVYRLKIVYDDKNTTSVSYSPPIISI